MLAVGVTAAAIAFVTVRTEPALATLGGAAIREHDFQRYLALGNPPARVAEIRSDPALRSAALEAYLDARAIREKARRVGIDQELRFKKAVELMEMKTLAQLFTERHRDALVRETTVSPADLREQYEQHKSEFPIEPRFSAHHLLVYVKGNPAFPDKGLTDALARKKADEALARLRAGATWQDIAKRYSDDVGTQQSAGLLRDRQFGYFAPEVEQVLRKQALHQPSDVIKTVFGYYVVEVSERTPEGAVRPFEQVSETLMQRRTEELRQKARLAFMSPIQRELGFSVSDAAKRDVSLLDENAIAPDQVLAQVAHRPVTEADFRWFCNDALMPSQRQSAFSRPGARQSMLDSFLDMRLLEAKARKDGLTQTPEFRARQVAANELLLLEFLQQRDKVGPAHERWNSDEERMRAERAYLDRVRTQVGLH
ncbi:MAG: peptidylprolyl isomerase [Polyangiaceae bacterium]